MEDIKAVPVEKKSSESMVIKYWVGIPSALFSILFFYFSFFGGGNDKDFWIQLLMAIAFGMVVFICFSKQKRVNALFTSILLFGLGVSLFNSAHGDSTGDAGVSFVWSLAFFIGGLSYLLKFYNTSIFLSIKKITQTRFFRSTVKVIAWCAVVAIGLLIITGLFSFLAGLSATTIIIVLLILILMK